MFRRFASTSTLPPTIRQLLSSPTRSSPSIQINGWVKSVRRQKKFSFAVISDGSSGHGLQAVFSDPNLAKRFVFVGPAPDEITELCRLTNGASVRLTGKLTESPGAGQDHELQVDAVEVLGECDQDVGSYCIFFSLASTNSCSRPIQYKNNHYRWIICGIMRICGPARTRSVQCCECVIIHCGLCTNTLKCVISCITLIRRAIPDKCVRTKVFATRTPQS